MRILLVAEESAGVQTLRRVLDAGHTVAGVLTSGGSGFRGATVGDVARGAGLPVEPACRVRDPAFADAVRAAGVDLLLNVHSLHIIDDAVLRAPRIGSFNLHPGRLPEYAGLNTVSWALYNGESRHGVTLHWMEPRVDAGPIAYQALLDVDEDETALRLATRCIRRGLELIGRLLHDAERDPAGIPRIPQDLGRRRYYGRAVPDGGRLTWSQPAARIVDFVRACDYYPLPSPWGHPRAVVGGREVGVAGARRTGRAADAAPGTVSVEAERIRVAARDEWVELTRVELDGRYLRPASLFEASPETESKR